MPSAATLARMRAKSERDMPNTGRIQATTRTRDTGGVTSDSWVTQSTSKCRVAPLSGREERRERSGQIVDRGTHRVAFPLGTVVALNNRIVVDGVTGGSAWRLILNVVGGTTPPTHAAELVVYCEETEPEPGEVIGDPA